MITKRRTFKAIVVSLSGIALLTSCGKGGGDKGYTAWIGDPPGASASLKDKASFLASQGAYPATQFELGIVEAMRAIETIYQYRYKHYSGELPLTPGGTNGKLPTNPDAKFDPAFLENAMKDALVYLSKADSALKKASGSEFAVVLDPKDFWFDINGNGAKDESEGLLEYLPAVMGNPRAIRRQQQNMKLITEIRFDTADADWALAYVHTLSGMAEMVLAMDPTPAIRQVVEGREALLGDGSSATIMLGLDNEVDSVAAFLLVLRGKPDKARTRKAHSHFLQMVASNKDFWNRLSKETDDDREWIPNPEQTSSFGVQVTQEMADGWQTVLADVEDVLEGRKLIPYWRTARNTRERSAGPVTPRGLNMKSIFMDPPETDIVHLLHGGVLAPYMEEGEIANMRSWREFGRMTGNQTSLFALWFN